MILILITLLFDVVISAANFTDEKKVNYSDYQYLRLHVENKEDAERALKILEDKVTGNTKNFVPDLGEIEDYLKSIAAKFPSICKLETIGKTEEHRAIMMLVVSNGKQGNQNILIDAGMRGSDWSAIMAGLYLVEQIAENFDTQSEDVKNNNWYLIPVLNPDGFVYSKTTDRFWTKNRRRISGGCHGVTLNRNFDTSFGVYDSSTIPCNRNFCFFEPFSESETKALKELSERVVFVAYVSIHAAGGVIIYPWLHSEKHIRKTDYEDHIMVASDMEQAMTAVKGTEYRHGIGATMERHLISGTSTDWMYQTNVRQSYLLEINDPDFTVVPERAELSSREVYAAMMELAAYV